MNAVSTEVFVEGFRVATYIGLHDPEMLSLQPIVIELRCTLQNPEITNDDIEQTFTYVPILEQVRILATQKKRRLIETFAKEIAEVCFADPKVVRVVVSVRKPDKFPAVDAVGTTRTFERKEAQ